MEILDTAPAAEARPRPRPKRKPATPSGFWRGFFRTASPWQVLAIAAWVYASLHLWWLIMDAANPDWAHPLRRGSGEVPTYWVAGLLAWIAAGLAITAVTTVRYGQRPALRWFNVTMIVAATWAWIVWFPDKAFFLSHNVVIAVIGWTLIRLALALYRKGEKIEAILQPTLPAILAQFGFLLLTGFVLAYGPGGILWQLMLAPWWMVGLGGSDMAILVYAKALIIIGGALVIPVVASRMTKF